METIEIITVFAIIVGPIAAVQIEKYLQRMRESKNRKHNIFKILMATRGTALSYQHVEALNRIDLEFSKHKKYSNVITAWKEYFDNLNQKPDEEHPDNWLSKNEDLLANLLVEMAKTLGYNFDKVQIKRNAYIPVAHANIEDENHRIRKGLIKILEAEKALPMFLYQDDKTIESNQELQAIMKEYYESEIKKR
ncbi:MAG: hypothetical protein PF448_04160 [Bacteroidales bacterium]|jgi:hypothetical protein|nr:hypothetical protein [Bacteroidales bacterium]